MNRRCFFPRNLGHPFCGPSGRGGDQALELHIPKQIQNSVQQSGFTSAGAAGNQQKSRCGRVPNGPELFLRVSDSAFPGHLTDPAFQIVRLGKGLFRQFLQPLRTVDLRFIQCGKIIHGYACQTGTYQPPCFQKPGNPLGHRIRFQREQLTG